MLKILQRHWLNRFEKYYRRNHWNLIVDFSFLVIIIILLSSVIGLYLYRPAASLKNVTDNPIINTPIDLNNPPLDLSAELLNSSIASGEGAIIKLTFKNNSDYSLNKLVFDFVSLNKNFSIDHLELLEENNPDISLNKTKIILPDLPANLSGEVSLKVYFKNKNSESKEVKEINWQISGTYLAGGQSLKQNFDLPLLNIASVLTVDSRAYYNSPQGDQLGAGPLPPIVSLPTNYWLFIEANADGDFNNFIYSAKLPRGVEVTGNRSILAGDFTYNKDSRQIIWRVPLVKAGSSDYRAGFEVQLIPTDAQFDKVLPFLSSARYSAQEAAGAKTKVNEEIDSPDTNLEFDLINKGEGQVTK